MAKMTWDEKEERREARRAGQRAVLAIRHCISAQKEANVWSRVDLEQAMYWEGRANKYEYEALQYVRKAARVLKGGY